MKKKKRAKVKSAPKVKRTKKISIFVIIPLILISLFVIAATIYKIVEIILTNNSSTNLPKLEISLSEAPIEQIDMGSKDTKYLNSVATLTTNDGSTTYYDVEIKGRGNVTWEQPKKPYQIKFNEKENLFNFGENKKWILLANYLDATSLRTDIAFYLEKLLDEDFALSGDFVELSIDNNYRGLYYLTEKAEIGKSRINLDDPYGLLIEVDNVYGKLEGCYYSKSNDCLIIKEAVNNDNEEKSSQDFMDELNLLIDAIEEKKYDDVSSIIDIDSFAKYFLLSEFTANPDAYSTSFFMYKNGPESKIYAGPGWDFDLALGNKNWSPKWVDQEFYSPFETMYLKKYINRSTKGARTSLSILIYDLMEIPEFSQRVKEIYQETLSGRGDELLEYIKSQAEYIRPAALRDQERWKIKTDFNEEVDYLIDWVAKRYNHFERTYGTNAEQ
ncbi:MAG: CotH kinase family protein [Candidatus Saccharibacteria bacterium]|nr:CotH kinase family protein [Candidatus Saccharibacteria bacterium]